MNTLSLLKKVKDADQDFEWYPTTDEIIQTIKMDLSGERFQHDTPSVLDCGSGDGRVLKALTDNDKYAIEKSRPLLEAHEAFGVNIRIGMDSLPLLLESTTGESK